MVQRIVCHEKFRTPLVSKKQLTSMHFSSLRSTPAGDGDTFYKVMQNGPSGTQDKKDIIFIYKFHADRDLKFDPSISLLKRKFSTAVHHYQLDCANLKYADLKYEDYDASSNLIYLYAYSSPEIAWKEFHKSSPIGVLKRIVCPTAASGVPAKEVQQ